MPKMIDSQGDIVQFKIAPHYFNLIKDEMKKADVRVLSKKWYQLIQVASIIEFVNRETKEKVSLQIKRIENFHGRIDEITHLFSDIDWFISSNDWQIPIVIYLGNIITLE